MRATLHDLALRVPLGRTVAVAAALVALFGVLGALEFAGAPLGLFGLDSEGTPPALYSALLDATGGALALTIGWSTGLRRWDGLGAFLLFMGADDLLTIHEHLQSWTGVDWQGLYLPIFAAGLALGLAAFVDVTRIRRSAAVLLAAGAAAWLGSQLCEHLEWHDTVKDPSYTTFATVEEVLEMAGSLLFAVAFVLTIRALAARRAPPVPGD